MTFSAQLILALFYFIQAFVQLKPFKFLRVQGRPYNNKFQNLIKYFYNNLCFLNWHPKGVFFLRPSRPTFPQNIDDFTVNYNWLLLCLDCINEHEFIFVISVAKEQTVQSDLDQHRLELFIFIKSEIILNKRIQRLPDTDIQTVLMPLSCKS